MTILLLQKLTAAHLFNFFKLLMELGGSLLYYPVHSYPPVYPIQSQVNAPIT